MRHYPSFHLLRCFASFFFGLLLLAPALAHAATATLENPGNHQIYSGIGVISGWKCSTNGPLTVRFNGGEPVPLVYGSERSDVLKAGACDSAEVGFVAVWNWAKLGDGEHTAVAYDNGVEFGRSTFEVGTLGEEFVRGAKAEVRVENFPSPGESTLLVWNQNSQHFEVAPEISGFAPADQAAFDRLVVGKRLVNVNDSRYYFEFPSTGRFVDVQDGEREEGSYRWRRTGPNTGTFTQNYDDDTLDDLIQDNCGTSQLTATMTFTSPTTASLRYVCNGEETDEAMLRLESLSGGGAESPSGFAPADRAAFDRLVVGKRVVSVDDSRYYTEFPSAGRFVEYEPGERYPGGYSYSNTGPNTGTLTQNYDDGDVCTSQFTFTSPTTGTSRYTCNDGDQGEGNWRLE